MLTGHLADMFLKDRSQFPPFAERVGNAKEIWLFGTSLEAMVAYHSGVFVKKLKESASLRFLLMDPQSPSVDARAHGLFSASKPEILRGDIERTIARIRQMKHACGSCSVSVRLTSFVPSHALVLIDPNSREGIIIVELYPYLVTSSDRPHFELTRADTKWYGFFLDQYESVWREAKEHALDEKNS